ncbi:MAG: hypothetical protein KBC72_00910 [Acinetobacter sp.]|nr:hypothetical protein [Acinetobacter sp.]
MDKKIERLIYFATFTLTLLMMIPLSAYVARQITLPIELLSSLIGMTALASTAHLSTYKFILQKSKNNASNQHNIIFVGSVIYLELKGIPYTITKTESKSDYAYHIQWTLSDPDTEQLRCIFCSICIHNMKGITPTQSTRRSLQFEWESNLLKDLNENEKKKLWQEQTKIIKDTYKQNKSAVRIIQRAITKNLNCEEMTRLVKKTVVR